MHVVSNLWGVLALGISFKIGQVDTIVRVTLSTMNNPDAYYCTKE